MIQNVRPLNSYNRHSPETDRKPHFVYAQEKVSNDTAAEWQLMKLSADDVRKYDDEDTNSVAADETVTSPGVHHLRYTVTGLMANKSYTGRLRATNIFGSSDWSSEFSFRTAVERMYITTKACARRSRQTIAVHVPTDAVYVL